MGIFQAIAGLGSSAAVVIVAHLFLKERDKERTHSSNERSEFLKDRQQDRLTWQNHLSHTTAVLEDLVSEMEEHRKWTDR